MATEVTAVHTPAALPRIPDGWAWKRLDTVCDGIFDCPHSTPVLTEVGPYVVRSQDIRSGVFRDVEAAHVSEETFRERVARAEPRHGDLLYSREGTYFGIAAEVPRATRLCLGQRMVLLRPRPSAADSRYLLYWLNSPAMASHIHGFRDGSVAERLNLPTIRSLPIALPPMVEQRAIAHILGTLDDKIELNRRMSETLEAMVRALFQSWFVSFEPVRARADGRDPSLPSSLAELFPSRLVDSEVGDLPEGWEAATFGDFADQLRDQVDPLESPDTPFRHFSIPAFDEGQWPKEEFGRAIKSHKSRVAPGAVLLSKLNPEIERVWLVDVEPDDQAVCSTEFLVLRPRPPAGRAMTYCLARSREFRRNMEGLVTGTSKSHQRAQAASLFAVPTVRPSAPIVQAFERRADTMLARSLECRREGRTLALLRDALLPKLISGDLRATDPGRLLGSAV